jgi:hypothetical protein
MVVIRTCSDLIAGVQKTPAIELFNNLLLFFILIVIVAKKSTCVKYFRFLRPLLLAVGVPSLIAVTSPEHLSVERSPTTTNKGGARELGTNGCSGCGVRRRSCTRCTGWDVDIVIAIIIWRIVEQSPSSTIELRALGNLRVNRD